MLPNAEPEASDRSVFLHALDAIEQGLLFFDDTGSLLHANQAASRMLEEKPEGEQLHAEVNLFARSLGELVRFRELTGEGTVEMLATRELPAREKRYRLKGSYIGLGLFGSGPSLLIALEKPAPAPLSDDVLKERFGLSKQESRIARFLVEGCSNQEIADTLSISPHTARHHTEHVLRKLGARSRAAAVSKILS
jgi:DNA-binding CsgD family transcriptional regulator